MTTPRGIGGRLAVAVAVVVFHLTLTATPVAAASTLNASVDGNTVTVSGTWSWENAPACDRNWAGWAIDWGDPKDPGHAVGSRSVGSSGDASVRTTGECGGGPGSRAGSIAALSHTYSDPGRYTVCAVTYSIELKAGREPRSSRELVAGGATHNPVNSEESPAAAPDAPRCLTVVIAAPAALTVSASVRPETAAPGDDVLFLVRIDNAGGASAPGAEVTLDLGAVLEHASVVSATDGGVLSGSSVRWSVGAIPSGGDTTVGVTVKLATTGWPAGTTSLAAVATVPGTNCGGGAARGECTARVSVATRASLNVSTDVDKPTASPGDTLRFSIAIKNTGTAAGSYTLADDLSGVLDHASFVTATDGGTLSGTTLRWTPGTLAPGEGRVVSYTVTLARTGWPAAATAVRNGVIAGGTDCAPGTNAATCHATSTVTARAALIVTAGVAAARSGPFRPTLTATVGDTIWFSLRVENSGDVLLTGVRITDTARWVATTCSAPPTSLAPGAAYTCVYSIEAPAGATTNTLTAEARETNPVRATATVAASEAPRPAIGLSADADPARLPVEGGQVTYTYRVTNTGNVRLTSILVTDPACATVSLAGGDTNANRALDTSETWRYTCRDRVLESTNRLVTASGSSDGRRVSTTDSLAVAVTVARPAIQVVTSAAPRTLTVGGGRVQITYRVTNVGNAPLVRISMFDPACGPARLTRGDGNGNSRLDTQEAWVFTCSATIVRTTTSRVVVTGELDASRGSVSATDQETITVAEPSSSPSPTPSPSSSPSPSPSPSPSVAAGESPSPSPSSSPSLTASASPSPSPSPSTSPAGGESPSPSPSEQSRPMPTESTSPAPTGSDGATPTQEVKGVIGPPSPTAAASLPALPQVTSSNTTAILIVLFLLLGIAASIGTVLLSGRSPEPEA